MTPRWLVWLMTAAACGHGDAAAPAAPAPAPSLTGVWGQELEQITGVHGPLSLVRDGDRWISDVAGQRATLTRDGDELVATFGAAQLRVQIEHGEPTARWHQPAGALLGPYATTIALAPVGSGRWTGTVAPLPERLRVYISIAADGSAFVRETEVNLGKRLGMLHVDRPSSAGELVFRDGKGAVAIRATLDGEHLHARITGLAVALDLTRRDRDHASGFYPRPSGDRGELRAVRDDGDGWPVASLEDVALDRDAIAAVVREIANATPTSPRSPAIHALVIARRGKLVVDEYFAGDSAGELHDLRSAGKTASTTLVGIAIDHHELATTDRVVDILGPSPGAADERRAQILVEHLLDMSTGLACDDNDDASPGNEDTMQQQTAQRDWYRYTWQLPMVAAPGAKAAYCSATINLLGAVLERRGHRTLDVAMFDDIVRPLDMKRAAINLMPTGEAYLGGGLRLRTRDFAKLAELVLEHGAWRGRTIVSADWLARATAPHASINGPADYGFGWWRTTFHVGGHDVEAYNAGGNGGQLAFAVPSLDLVIAIDAGNYGDFGTWRKFRDELVPRILAAAR